MSATLCRLRWPFALAALSLMTTAATAEPVTATCSPTKVRVMASVIDGTYTLGGTWKSIPEAAVSFTQGGSEPSCVVVRFSAMAFGTSVLVRIRAMMDNTTAAAPGEVYFGIDNKDTSAAEAHSFDFLFPDVAPGAHVVRVQMNGGGYIHRHTTIVEHAP